MKFLNFEIKTKPQSETMKKIIIKGILLYSQLGFKNHRECA